MTTPLEFAEATHIGGREENQDFYGHLITDDGGLFVVADGMGGHRGGALASQLFVRAVLRQTEHRLNDLTTDPVTTLNDLTVQAAGDIGRTLRDQHPDLNPRTTCVMAWHGDGALVSAHVGDSRLYLLDPSKVIWRSRDHSIIQLLKEQGEVAEGEVAGHPDQSLLYKSIGGGKEPEPSVQSLDPLHSGQAVVLCTDGFWEQIDAAEMFGLVTSDNLSADLQRLVEEAVKRGGPDGDNATAQVVRLKT